MMNIAKVKKYNIVIASSVLTMLYLIFWPYEYAGGDMIEIIPALKKISNPSLYSRDFYLSFNSGLGFHERSFFLYFLHFIGGIHPLILFSIYLLCLFFFCLGLVNLMSLFLQNFAYQVIFALIILFPMKYTSVGGNELFYAMATPAIFAKTLGLWSIISYIQEKKWIAYIALIFVSYFHILVGVQLFIMIGLCDLIMNINKSSFIKLFAPIVTYLCMTIPYVILLIINRKSPHLHGNSLIDFIEFRIGHHFFIEYSSLISILILMFLYVAGISYWRSKNNSIYWFILIELFFLILYLLFGDWLRMDFAIQFQWLKTTIWIELFSIIALICFLSVALEKVLKQSNLWFVTSIMVLGIFLSSFLKQKEDPDFLKEEEKLAIWTQKNTDVNALFAYPPIFTRFKTISERSSWIDYKAISHQIAYLIPWADRVQRIFDIDLEKRRKKVDLITEANKNYENINDHNLTFLFYTQNVNYIILPTKKEPSEFMYPAYSTDHYTIYKRRDLN